MRDAADRHQLPLEDDFPLLGAAAEFLRHGEILVNRIADVVESLCLGLALRGTARKARHPTLNPSSV
jgi:hypothetical protein